MTDWSIGFDPVLPWAVIAVLGALGLVLVAALASARARGALLRACRSRILLAALANPTVRNEEREPLTDIAVAVIDRSLSQESAGRTQRTDEAEAGAEGRHRPAAQHRTPHRRGEVRHQRRG